MISFWTIAVNAFMELVRKPVFLALFIASSLFIVFLANIPYFGFGVGDRATEATSHDVKMVMEGSLAVMVVSGLFGAVLCASSSLSQEYSAARPWRCGPSRWAVASSCWPSCWV